jgi:Concanavalin A-like lectin/glucanases superfamily
MTIQTWLVRFVACALLCIASATHAALIHQWSFNDLLDATPNDLVTGQGGALNNGATVVSVGGEGLLQLDGVNDYFRSATFVSPNITAKTLVAWVRLDNLTQQAGSALTLEQYTGSDQFDAIVYAERTANQWMNGSDFFFRTPISNNGGVLETLTNPAEIMLAITYSGGVGPQTISLYRNGSPYASLSTGVQTFSGSTIDALIGLRHDDRQFTSGTATGFDSFLAGFVNEARIYDTALSASEIAGLNAAGPNAVPEPMTALLMVPPLAALIALRRRSIKHSKIDLRDPDSRVGPAG